MWKDGGCYGEGVYLNQESVNSVIRTELKLFKFFKYKELDIKRI